MIKLKPALSSATRVLMRKMFTTALCTELGKPLEIKQKNEMTPDNDEVLVSVKYCGVNFADILLSQGKYQAKYPLPFTPGSEITGVVSAVGKDVTSFVKGDRVVSVPIGGGYATQCLAPEQFTWKLPASVDFKSAAALLCNYGTAYLALTRKANLQEGETVLVTAAAGGTGLAAVEIASKVFKANVIAACGGSEKGKLAQEKGAAFVIDYKTENVRQRIKEITHGCGVNVVFDPVGGDLFVDYIKSLADEGRIITIGYASGTIPKIPANLLLLKSGSALGVTWGDYRRINPEVFKQSVRDVLKQAELGNVSPYVGKEFPLNKINEAFNYVTSRSSTGKVIINMDKQGSNL